MPIPTDAKPLTQNLLTHGLDNDSRLYGESETGDDQGYFTVAQLKTFLDSYYATRVGTLSLDVGEVALSASGSVTGGSLTQDLANISLTGLGAVTGATPSVVFLGNGTCSTELSQNRLSGEGTGNYVYESAQGFVMKGSYIDAITLYHIHTDPNDRPNGYSIGDGGTTIHEIRTNNSGARHDPSSTVLATTSTMIGDTEWWSQAAAEAAYPSAVWSQHGETATRLHHFRKMNLTSRLYVSAGTKLWIVSRNPASDRNVNSVAMDHCRNYGQAIWPTADPDFDSDMEFQVRYKPTSGSGWEDDSDSSQGLYGIFNIHGDVTFGQTVYQVATSADPVDGDTGRNVDGTKQARQVWDVDLNYTLTKLWIAACRRPGGTAPIACAIKRNGSLIHTSYFSGFPNAGAGVDPEDVHNYAQFISADLPNLSVSAGDQVLFELSTTSGTNYEVPFMQEGQKAGYFTAGRAGASMAGWHGQYTDNGSTWTAASSVYEMPIGLLAVPG